MAKTAAAASQREHKAETTAEAGHSAAATPVGADRHTPGHESIALLAYSYWLERNGNEGSAEEDWFRAEKDLRERKPSRG